jgi:two-component system, NarL family, response regulator LiaR
MTESVLNTQNATPTKRAAGSLNTRDNHGDDVRLIVVDPDALSRRTVVDALRLDGRFAVIAQAESSVEAVELARYYRPQLVVIAASPEGIDAIGVVEELAESAPDVGVVLLSASRDLELETRAVRAGAAGFLDKTSGLAAIAHGLKRAALGESVISREMTRHLVDRLRRTPEDGNGIRPVKSSLTDREWEILDLICIGSTTREMADGLFLSRETVNSHVKRILRKLGVHSRNDAIAMAGSMRGQIFA